METKQYETNILVATLTSLETQIGLQLNIYRSILFLV
jgi:hypothetical protein